MRGLLKISLTVLILSLVLLFLNLFDILSFSTVPYRICGVVCLISLFLTVYSRVWLIRYRRKRRNNHIS